MFEYIHFWRQASRLTLGMRGQIEYIGQIRDDVLPIPIYEKLFLGGEYTVRGFDLRTIGPTDKSGLVLGGNKSLLFNVEEAISIAGPVRLIFFYDAGQVRDVGQPFVFIEELQKEIFPAPPLLAPIYTGTVITDPSAPPLPTV